MPSLGHAFGFASEERIREERERDRLIACHKPQFIKWTDWVLDGDAVTYGGGAYKSPSACRWIVPGCYHG